MPGYEGISAGVGVVSAGYYIYRAGILRYLPPKLESNTYATDTFVPQR